MEHNTTTDQADQLEERLRSMILNNVTMDSGSPNQEHSYPARDRNRRSRWTQSRDNTDSHGPAGGNSGPRFETQERTQSSFHRPARASQRGFRSSRGGGRHSMHESIPQEDQTHPPRQGQPAQAIWNERSNLDKFIAQSQFLEHIASQELPPLEMPRAEIEFKDAFRLHLSRLCQQAAIDHCPTDATKLELVCFGSLGSGFALPESDMDLALMASRDDPHLPRLLQKTLLNSGYGARLLTRTRVPILKICELPGPELLNALREDRQKWDELTPEEQERFDKTGSAVEEKGEEEKGEDGNEVELEEETDPNRAKQESQYLETTTNEQNRTHSTKIPSKGPKDKAQDEEQRSKPDTGRVKKGRSWYREKRPGPLDFPKTGVGIQCDINFSNPLGIHNTALLRCYSYCDVRVRLMIVFIKAWASRRKINSSYNGTLSSYGYVLMVLHYLVNVAQPPVCPNLQLLRRNEQADRSDPYAFCCGYDIRFWKNEAEIQTLAAKGMMTHNRQPLGELLQEFFFYYAKKGNEVPKGGFAWTHAVLSLRSPGGIMTKRLKGWTGAKVTYEDKKEIRHRYLFAIEDPFELDHNVARTVTHNGIVAIRDEFRRAWRILCQIGNGHPAEADLFEPVISLQPPQSPSNDLGALQPTSQAASIASTDLPIV